MLSYFDFIYKAIGFCFIGAGFILGYIALFQRLPRYNFYITLFSFVLIFVIYTLSTGKDLLTPKETVSATSSQNQVLAKKAGKPIKKKKKIRKKTRKVSSMDFSKYPSVFGSAKFISANLFYVGGRYVKLFGVDSPDSDQICSNMYGTAYNCGAESLSWIINEIDDDPIKCYLLKLDHNGKDTGICLWKDKDVGTMVVSAGWGVAKTDETDIYKPYEAKAQSDSLGLWQGSFYLPEDWREIKRQENNFKIEVKSTGSNWFNFFSWF